MRRTSALLLAAGPALLLLVPCARAAGAAEGPSFAWAAVKMLLSLVAVLGILLGASHYARKYTERFSGREGASGGRSLAVTEVRRVGPKTQVVVLSAFGAKYLLGLTPAGISLIDKVHDAEAGRTP